MKIKKIRIENVKSFQNAELEFSEKINVIVGANNNGKTTILNCVNTIQHPKLVGSTFVRKYKDSGAIRIWIDQRSKSYFRIETNNVSYSTDTQLLTLLQDESRLAENSPPLPNTYPLNFVIPYQSKRKVGAYNESITIDLLNQVHGNLANLYSKIDQISNPEYQPAYSEYVQACEEILGFRISTTNSTGGKKAVYTIRNDVNIHMDAMGEGISNLLGLIVDLCKAENQLFIIEEPENDVHPKALKKLLDLIVKKSNTNQFIVTTHSNIVLRHLASIPGTKLFNVNMEFIDRVPTSSVDVVDSMEKRRVVLEELGYELFDYGLWDAWIFFEESSAERIVKDFLIPWYFPDRVNKIRTFSTNSTSQLESKFDDFNRLFVFLHLEPVYKNKVWVVIDGGVEEGEIIQKMMKLYSASGWNESNFNQLSSHDFESYYPTYFSESVQRVLNIADKKAKREAKKLLLNEVIDWANSNQELAKIEFKVSAIEVIKLLERIFNQYISAD
jgi:AAA15 family ATPase/GTPase